MKPEIPHLNQLPGDADGATTNLVNLGLENVISSLHPRCGQAHLSLIFQAVLFHNLLSSLTIKSKHTSRGQHQKP